MLDRPKFHPGLLKLHPKSADISLNSTSEIRNPKQTRNPNSENLKLIDKVCCQHRFWGSSEGPIVLKFRILKIVSYFDIQISDFFSTTV
jgi:hypothetical protein